MVCAGMDWNDEAQDRDKWRVLANDEAQDRDKWRVLANAVTKLRVP